MDWKTLTKEDAKKAVVQWQQHQQPDRSGLGPELPHPAPLNDSYSLLRNDFCEKYQDICDALDRESVNARRDYLVDLEFGLYIYEKLNTMGFSARTASFDQVWYYLSVSVVPDLVCRRYGRISPDRYYANKRRIWLKSIWWYIHLSLQVTDGKGDLSRTRDILQHNSTDTILQIVDRAGPGGYRVNVTRELMRRYAEKARTDPGGELLRRLMVLYVAKVRVVEPELYEGGVVAYVDSLLRYYNE